MKKEVKTYLDYGKTDISLGKLVKYVAIFMIPLILTFSLSLWVSSYLSDYFEASPITIVQILMVLFTFLIFFIVIPYIRERENVRGIRYALIAMVIAGISMTLPSVMAGNYGVLLNQLVYLASYILLTFIYVPEVLGFGVNVADWFKHHKQLMLLGVYLAVVLFYVIGFGAIYHDIYHDPAHPQPFMFSVEPTNHEYSGFIYYSLVTFATIGYGDVTPVSRAARFTMGMEAICGMVINVVFIAILLVFISSAQSREVKKEEEEIEKEEKMIEKEEKEVKGEKGMIKEEETEIKTLGSREEKDIRRLLKKIEKIKK